MSFLIVVMLLTALGELSITVTDARIGYAIHMALGGLLLYRLSQTSERQEYRLIMILILIPLLRVISLSLPFSNWPKTYWYVVLSLPLAAGMLLIIRRHAWSARELGITGQRLPLQAVLAFLGLILGWVQYQIVQPSALVPGFTLAWRWLPIFILLLSTGLLEELLYRGLLQNAAIPVLGYTPAIIFVATIYAVLHIGYASIRVFLFMFAVGLLFGIFSARTSSIIGTSLAHGLANVSLLILWPLWLPA